MVVFLLDEDRRFYLETLKTKCRQHGLAVLGYCLMTNHVHLVAIPDKPDSMARALGEADGRYALWFNRRYRRSGHLWQNRFYSCALGRTHLLAALSYVDLNPVRGKLVRRALEYEWSSARAHISGADGDDLVDDWAWSELRFGGDWSEVLGVGHDRESYQRLREATYSGQPFGEEDFVTEMERRAGRELRSRRASPKPHEVRAASAA